MPTKEEIDNHYNYDPITGVFTPVLTHAVYLSTRGYLDLWIGGSVYRAHRCAMVTSGISIDGFEVDHINGDVSDNRISNLRTVDRGMNCRNAKIYKTNSSGVTGVLFNKNNGKWTAAIQINKVRKHLGYFNDFNDAVAARKDSEKGLDFTPRHGK